MRQFSLEPRGTLELAAGVVWLTSLTIPERVTGVVNRLILARSSIPCVTEIVVLEKHWDTVRKAMLSVRTRAVYLL